MEGGIGFGLGAVLFSEITLGENGRIQQSNFHDYRSLRIDEMPEVEVAILESSEKPTGVGEPGVPPIGPAVANAWRALTGQPVRRLPLRPVSPVREPFMMRAALLALAGAASMALAAGGLHAQQPPADALRPSLRSMRSRMRPRAPWRCSRRPERSSSIRAA